jgi:hypothetical protein
MKGAHFGLGLLALRLPRLSLAFRGLFKVGQKPFRLELQIFLLIYKYESIHIVSSKLPPGLREVYHRHLTVTWTTKVLTTMCLLRPRLQVGSRGSRHDNAKRMGEARTVPLPARI